MIKTKRRKRKNDLGVFKDFARSGLKAETFIARDILRALLGINSKKGK